MSWFRVLWICIVGIGCSSAAPAIRASGVIVSERHAGATSEGSSTHTHLSQCLSETEKYLDARVVRATFPTYDIAAAKAAGGMAFRLEMGGKVAENQNGMMHEMHVKWIYGSVIVSNPSDAVLDEMSKLAMRMSSSEQHGVQPFTKWHQQQGKDVWQSDPVAFQFFHAGTSAKITFVDGTLDDIIAPSPPDEMRVLWKVSELEGPAHASGGNVPAFFRPFMREYRGTVTFLATAIELWDPRLVDATLCYPVVS
jgi:hypothetical protein